MHRMAIPAVAWLLTVLLLCPAAGGATLHFIAVVDTNDATIGTIDDLSNAVVWANKIAQYAGLTLNFQSLSGQQLSVAATRQLIDALPVGADDVVYFFYSGHGGNPGDRRWPVLYYTTTTNADNVSMDEVVEALVPKNPRLLIVLADCCNSYPWQTGRPRAVFQNIAASAQGIANYQRLFATFQGSVLSSGCAPGQYSLGAAGSGGVFVNNFMNALQSLAETESILTWDQVFRKTAADTAAEAAPELQNPQYVITEGQVAGFTPDQLGLDPPGNQTGDGQLTGISGTSGGGLLFPACGALAATECMLAAMWIGLVGLRRSIRRPRA